MIKAQIVADSIDPRKNRLTTMLITFPRFILAELNTHRMLSKNSASSRAIPFNKMVESVQDNPFIPIAWQKDHKGMQGTEYFTNKPDLSWLKMNHLKARDQAVERAVDHNERGLTKQLCNRLLEPFMWHTVLISGTEFSNFFELRCSQYYMSDWIDGDTRIFKSRKEILSELDYEPTDSETDLYWLQHNKGQAEIHMMALAEAMWDAMNESTPKQLQAGEWYIPFGDKIDLIDYLDWKNADGHLDNDLDEQDFVFREDKIKISTAMCARTSYTVVGAKNKVNDYEKDISLHDLLLESGHMSPFEHCARAMTEDEYYRFKKGESPIQESENNLNEDMFGWCRNYRGFVQYRELID